MNAIRLLRISASVAAALLLSAVNSMAADAGYAPAGTDLIVRVDGARISRGKVFAAIKAKPEFAKVEKDMRNVLAKYNLTLDDVLKTDICFFARTVKLGGEKPVFHLVARNPKISGDTALSWLDSERNGKLEKTQVDGKTARVAAGKDGSVTMIALDKDLVQFSVNAEPCRALVPRPKDKLAGFLNPKPAICLVYKGSPASYRVFAQLIPEIAPFLSVIDLAVVNLTDDGDLIRLDAELRGINLEQAQNLEGMLGMAILGGMMSCAKKSPEKAELLQRFRVVRNDTKVFVTFECPVEMLNDALLN